MDKYFYHHTHFAMKGSRMTESLQDGGIPVLDVLVRESIQNSLDARDDSSKAKNVIVEYNTGQFNIDALATSLEGIDIKKKGNVSNKYLAIRDRNTVGLTGTFDDEKSNLHKLLYGFMEPQNNEGAGGSWGLGKTVYFRLGIGLVIYYSRVKTKKGYESLMSMTLVEDETAQNAIVPPIDGTKYGIAFWGERIPEKEEVHECRDIIEINKILKAFSYEPFGEKETGTAILIPFINEGDTLANNRSHDEESDATSETNEIPFWEKSIEDYLRIAVQRWYSARLNNLEYLTLYPQSKILTVRINGNAISASEQKSFSSLLMALYNKAALSILKSDKADKITFDGNEIFVKEIQLRRSIDRLQAGQVAFIKLKKEYVDKEGISFYQYADLKAAPGTPVIAYCRQPGMVIAYETKSHTGSSEWCAKIPTCLEDEYLIGFFVLNSAPNLKKASMTLEGYVRSCEKAIHDKWEDKQIDQKYTSEKNYTPSIISNIRQQVSAKVGEAIAPPKPNEGEKRRDVSLGNLLGTLFMPVGGGGHRPDGGEGESSTSTGGEGGSGTSSSSKSMSFSYEVSYPGHDILRLQLNAKTKKGKESRGFKIEIQIASSGEAITSQKWHKDLGIAFPLSIKSVSGVMKIVDGNKKSSPIALGTSISGLDCKRLMSRESNEYYGVIATFKDKAKHSFGLDMTIDIEMSKKDVRPIIVLEEQ